MARVKMSITVDETTKQNIDRVAEERNISISRAVERLVEFHDSESCILKKDILPILQNMSAVLDGEEKGLNAGKRKKVVKLIRRMWELL